MDERAETFGQFVRRYRRVARLTQEELAERSGLSARGISDLERGARRRPHRETVQMLAGALGLDAAGRARLDLLARAEQPTRAPADGALSMAPAGLIGRDDDLVTVAGWLAARDVRLITLWGPGGVGKTSLALALAARHEATASEPAIFVPLAAIADPALVLPTIAHALGLSDADERPPLERLTVYLRSRPLLLVLDNVEHLLPAAPSIGALLAACPALRVLATSRELLHLSSERAYPVAPLGLPVASDEGPGQIEASDAVRLFVERARAIAPEFTVTEDTAPYVARICSLADGLPLAIELAAARLRHLDVAALAARMPNRLQILTHGAADLPARQQTLRQTIAWSVDLLPPEAQRLLRWLAVFRGGWTLDEADSLLAETGVDVVDALARLVDASLVMARRVAPGQMRYEMLETIREYAEEQLRARDEADAARERHMLVMRAVTDAAERGLQSGARAAWSRRAADELDNVRAALRWSLDHDRHEIALHIAGNLDWFWDAVGRDGEGWSWCQDVLAAGDGERATWAWARAAMAGGAIAWNIGDMAASDRLLTESVARFRTMDDDRSLGQALANGGLTKLYLGDTETACQMVGESVTLFTRVGDRWSLGLARFILGDAQAESDPDVARANYERSLTEFRALGEPWGIALALNGLGGLAMRRRDYETARALMEEGLKYRESLGNLHATALSLTSLGELARRQGDDERAMGFLERGLARFRDAGDAEHIAWTLHNIGLVRLRRRELAPAARAFREELTIRAEQGNLASLLETIDAVAALASQCGDPERATVLLGTTRAMRATQALPESGEAKEERSLLADHASECGQPTFDAVPDPGGILSLDEAVRLAHEFLATAMTHPHDSRAATISDCT